MEPQLCQPGPAHCPPQEGSQSLQLPAGELTTSRYWLARQEVQALAPLPLQATQEMSQQELLALL